MFAEGASGVTLVLVIGAIPGLGAMVVSFLAYRSNSRSKRSETNNQALTIGQAALAEGLEWTKQHNRELRVDLLDAERRVDELEAKTADQADRIGALEQNLVDNEVECKASLAMLRAEIARLKEGS